MSNREPVIRCGEPSSPDKHDDLELPALDGDEVDDVEGASDLAEIPELGHDEDPFDDSTGDDDGAFEIGAEGEEGGWLVDAESAGALDIGPIDVALEPEGKVLVDDEADTKSSLEDLVADDEVYEADGGEEGPLDEDEELKEEDLPALDADEDGDVPDEDLYDRGLIAGDEDLRWDDRAWSRQPRDPGESGQAPRGLSTESTTKLDEHEDSGPLAVAGEDPVFAARDATWRTLEETGRVMAVTSVPGGSVVLAVSVPDRSRALIVRIQPDGEARIIAEVDPRRVEDDGEACIVTFVRWDGARGALFVGGNFGVEVYRPGV